MNLIHLSKKELIARVEELQLQLNRIKKNKSRPTEINSDFFNNAPDMFFSVHPNGKILSVNEFGAENLGYSKEELIGEKVWKVVHKDDLTQIQSSINEIVNKKIVKSELDFRKIKKNGSVIFVHEHTQLIFKSDKSVKEILIICRDITARKEIENILKSEEEKFRTLANNLNVGLYRSSADEDGYFIEANPTFIKMLGYKNKEELLEVNIANIYSTPKGRQNFINAINEKGFVKNMEVSMLKKDKTKITCKLSTVLIKDKKGKGVYCDGIVEDITAVKSIEKNLEIQNKFLNSIIESLTHPFYVINVDDYSIEIANSAAEKSLIECLNSNSAEERSLTKGKGYCYSIINNNKVPCHEINQTCPIIEIKKTGKPFSVEYEKLDKNGKKHFYEVNAYPIFNDKHELKQVIEYTLDITDRKSSEKAIKQREEQYRALFQMAPVGIVIEDQNAIIIDANPAYCQTVGFDFDELMGKHISKLAHPENKKQVDKNIKAILKGKILKHVKKSINKNGDILYTELLEKAIWLPDGQQAVMCFARNITRQKEEQDKLIEQEKKFRDIFNAFPDIYFKSTIDGIITEISPSAKKITGFSVNEIIGKKSSTFYYSEKDWKNIKNAFDKSYKLKDFNTRIKTKTKGFVHCSFSASVIFDKHKKPIEIEGVLRDITEREKAEIEIRKLSGVVEQSPVIVVITQLDGTIEYVNPKFCDVTGYSYNEVIGKNPRILQSGKTPLETYISLWNTLNSGKEWYGEFLNKRKNNEEYWESAYIFPLKDESGKISRFIAQMEDITARKKMEQDLIDARDKAEESDKLKSAFLANMSHEIRTPMNAILGFSQLLSEPDTSIQEQSHYIQLIQNSGNDLLVLIDDIIDISKIEAGQIKIFKSDYFLDNILSNLHISFSEILKAKGHSNKLNLNYITPKNADKVTIYTDVERLKQVFVNLINNAIKFTDTGTVEFGFSIENEIDKIYFFVSDTGIGIDKDKQDVIFNSFRQASDSNTRLYGGTGLGLAITKKMVELLGGQIKVRSTVGKGSTFFFSLPLADGNTSQPLKSNKTNFETQIKKQFDWSNLELLIVEDDDQGFFFFEKVLKNTGIKITRATTGLAAVNLCRKKTFNLVLMDIQLPEMDGLAATKLIKESNKNIPIIAQTAYALSGEREKCINAGCDDYISKPINIYELTKKMDLLLK